MINFNESKVCPHLIWYLLLKNSFPCVRCFSYISILGEKMFINNHISIFEIFSYDELLTQIS